MLVGAAESNLSLLKLQIIASTQNSSSLLQKQDVWRYGFKNTILGPMSAFDFLLLKTKDDFVHAQGQKEHLSLCLLSQHFVTPSLDVQLLAENLVWLIKFRQLYPKREYLTDYV